MSRHAAYRSRAVRPSGGFTLVELLVVVAIITILAAIVLGGVQRARESARIASTRATILKLHRIISARYDAYRTRRVPINTAGMQPVAAAQVRLAVLRDLMRMEMPERWNDVKDMPVVPGLQRPSLSVSYFARYNAGTLPTPTYGSAECLYMIVAAAGADARDSFQESEIGDADQDGFLEFHDAWGNPIYFLRWAPAFDDSEVQPNIIPPNLLDPVSPPPWDLPALQVRKQAAAEDDHDPFDPRKVDMGDPNDPSNPPRGWRLVPLICSAGPDGIYDINFNPTVNDPTGFHYQGNPYQANVGQPMDVDNTSVTAPGPANGRLDHYDNIHNHRLEAE